MTATPTISVVICAYTEERWGELLEAVRSVEAQSSAADEIIVVCDHNPALFARAQAELPHVVVENDQVRGLGGARNSGVAAASGEIVAFLDDDAIASRDWLARFRAAYADPEVVGVGGSITPVWLGGRPRWFPDEFAWVVGCSYRGLPESPATVRNLIGCNMSYRRAVIEEVGGFRLGYGCDETDFCIRLHQRWPEKVLLYDPEAGVRHQVPASRRRWKHFASRCFFEGRSKAVVSWLVGSDAGLDSERRHVLRTLPRGVANGLADAIRRGDASGLGRAGAIVAGLAITSAGYVSGRLGTAKAAEERGYVDPGSAGAAGDVQARSATDAGLIASRVDLDA